MPGRGEQEELAEEPVERLEECRLKRPKDIQEASMHLQNRRRPAQKRSRSIQAQQRKRYIKRNAGKR